MKKKHYKLVAGLLAMTLAFFPIAVNAKSRYVPNTGHSINHAAKDSKPSPVLNVDTYQTLRDVYKVPTDQLQWWTQQINLASEKQEVPNSVIISMLAVESKFNLHVKSEPGTVGVSQIVSAVWNKRLKKLHYNIKNPSDNIMAGAYILAIYKKECGNWNNALICYNVGDGNFKRHEQIAKQKEYMKKINVELAKLKTLSLKNVG